MPKQKQKTELAHIPVLVQKVLECLEPKAGQGYLDLTAGYGGHSGAILEITGAPSEMVLVDRDETAVQALERKFKSSGAEVIHSDFLSALQRLASFKRTFDMILADLGVSSPHLDEPQRGFSFNTPGPLDMRMDRSQQGMAAQLVNESNEGELAEIFRKYGEEPKASAIAKAIAANRPVNNTSELAAIIARASGWRRKRGKIHPATKSFQALRISVNDELNQLQQGLPLMAQLLKPGGRMVIISFHSLEDRIVKQFLADHSGNRYDAELSLLTKKPITARPEELVSNPRARSAKLRAAAKIKTNRKD